MTGKPARNVGSHLQGLVKPRSAAGARRGSFSRSIPRREGHHHAAAGGPADCPDSGPEGPGGGNHDQDHQRPAQLRGAGRPTPRPHRTGPHCHQRAGHSITIFGIAFDIGVFEGNSTCRIPQQARPSASWARCGTRMGGNWKTIVDQPHYQLRPSWAASLTEKQMLAELQQRRQRNAGLI